MAAKNDFEYDIFVPVYDNNGKQYPEELIATFKKRLVEKFGGLTDTRYRNEGSWKIGGVIQRDEIVIWRALSQGKDERNYMVAFKEELASALQQEEILIIRRQVESV